MPKTHASKVGAGKWQLGKALCGCTTGRYTPVSDDPSVVTCDRCKAALNNAYADPCRLVPLPGSDRVAIRGTARVRLGEGKLAGLFVVSAITDRMMREDIDTAGDVFLARGVAEHINEHGLNVASAR